MEYTLEDIWLIEEFKELQRGDVLYDKELRNSDGTPWRWRINGKVKTWKRDKQRISIPIKRGFYDFGYITEHNFRGFAFKEADAE